MKDLYEKTEHWFTKHKYDNNIDNIGKFQKKIFYTEKILIPISTLTIYNIIESLPDAPEFIDEDQSWEDGGLKKNKDEQRKLRARQIQGCFLFKWCVMV